MNKHFTVCLHCMTYNHAPYIENCMNGFVLQQTSFSFVALIVDDASTDNNAAVIQSYIDKFFIIDTKDGCFIEDNDYGKVIFARHKSNKNCYFVFVRLNQNHYSIKKDKEVYLRRWLDNSKYCAFCEGDDFWIYPQKLQKQVDLMESDHELGLTYTNANVLYQSTGICVLGNSKPYEDLRSLIYRNPIMTLTTLFRLDLYFDYQKEIKPLSRDWKLGDYPIWIWLAAHSKLAYIDNVTATYRVLSNSASHSTDVEKQVAMFQSDFDVQIFFLNKYLPDDNELRKQIEDKKNRRIAVTYDAHGKREEYLSYLKAISDKTWKERLKFLLFSFKPIYNLRRSIISQKTKS